MSLYFDEEDAAEKLREQGYRVTKVMFPATASNIKDLIEYFYARRLYYNPDRLFQLVVIWWKIVNTSAGLLRSAKN